MTIDDDDGRGSEASTENELLERHLSITCLFFLRLRELSGTGLEGLHSNREVEQCPSVDHLAVSKFNGYAGRLQFHNGPLNMLTQILFNLPASQ
jgi:hypothetical protein